MKYEDLLKELKKNKFDFMKYYNLAIEDKFIRDKLIGNITGKEHINIYYNSYYLINEASKVKPALFYEYWEVLVPLLKHPNSYHRSISHWILSNLVIVDEKNKFEQIRNLYFNVIYDVKFSTALEGLKDIVKVSKNIDIDKYLIPLFLEFESNSKFNEKQNNRMNYEILLYFRDKIELDERILSFIKNSLNSSRTQNVKEAKNIIGSMENNLC